jgi:hypothetical protein
MAVRRRAPTMLETMVVVRKGRVGGRPVGVSREYITFWWDRCWSGWLVVKGGGHVLAI